MKQKHITAIELLEAIEYYEKRIKNGYASMFGIQTYMIIHNREIYEKCIERLKERYAKLIIQIVLEHETTA